MATDTVTSTGGIALMERTREVPYQSIFGIGTVRTTLPGVVSAVDFTVDASKDTLVANSSLSEVAKAVVDHDFDEPVKAQAGADWFVVHHDKLRILVERAQGRIRVLKVLLFPV
jgi:hypothetical protein